jgi:hypothetical protein
MGDISLAEFSRRFAPLAWQAEELAAEDPDVANYAAQIDLRLVEYADRYWTEDHLRGLLGPLIMAPGHSESGTVVHDAEIGTQTF